MTIKQHRARRLLPVALAASLVLAACGGDDESTDDGGDDTETTTAADESGSEGSEGTEAPDEGGDNGSGDSTAAGESAGRQSEWYDEAEFTRQVEARDKTPEGPEGEPWLQAIEPEYLDTSEYAVEGPWTVCFSNVGVGNPWRAVGWTNMQQQVEALGDSIDDFVVREAGGSEEQQIADIEELVGSGNCDILIVSPASTAALTPVVETACESLPVIVFDRGVNTDCPVTFIKPIGGYAFGADGADFLVENVEEGGNILALRILPGVDVLETRYVAGQIIMEEAGLNILAAEFSEGDKATVKSIIQDLIDRGEQIDGVWMDAGDTASAVVEAFQENGLDVPPMNGEDQQDFLATWRDEDLTAIAPTYPTYQWRTPILAAEMILSGEEVPGGDWLLPQPAVTEDNIDSYFQEGMPPLHYALCGCEDMANYPDAWQG